MASSLEINVDEWMNLSLASFQVNEMLERDHSQKLVRVWLLPGLCSCDLSCQPRATWMCALSLSLSLPLSSAPMMPIHQAAFIFEQCHLNDTVERRRASLLRGFLSEIKSWTCQLCTLSFSNHMFYNYHNSNHYFFYALYISFICTRRLDIDTFYFIYFLF